jgi:hypothetical protein
MMGARNVRDQQSAFRAVAYRVGNQTVVVDLQKMFWFHWRSLYQKILR